MCAHHHHFTAATMTKKLISHEIVRVLLIFSYFVTSLSSSEAEILHNFKSSLKNADALSKWDGKHPPCQGDHETWNGVLCVNGTIWGLKLENMGLAGLIDVDSLVQIKNLKTISFMNNNFDGPLPYLWKLNGLKSIYLSNNQFYGEILPDTFSGMLSLKKLYMDNNSFSGPIPASLSNLTKLKELRLENNDFDGGIPVFPQERFNMFNVSNNQLAGEIPVSLSHMSASAFSGNPDLCGAPLKACTISTDLSTETLIIVVILMVAAFAALVSVVIILCSQKQPPPPSITTSSPKLNTTDLDLIEQGHTISASSSPDHPKRGEHVSKLTFLDENIDKFEMKDLLKSAAEILGSGMFGSTYKAALNDGEKMVVKRFRYMTNVSREEFHEHMRRLGRLKHPNVLSIVAFYYRKDEKLLVTEFVEKVSLAVHLHANRSRSLPSPDWPTRLKIVKGVASGLKYLSDELPSLTAPHGHIKSSNVLLDGSYNPILTDYGLIPIVNQEHAQEHMIAYKSPEYKNNHRITKKTDVWGLGILILEILTGRYPFELQGKANDTDLKTWVESVVHDYSNVDVFDAEMKKTKHCEGEMMKLLKIGLRCCETDVDMRPDTKEAVEMIEEIKDKEDVDKRSSRGLSEELAVTFN